MENTLTSSNGQIGPIPSGSNITIKPFRAPPAQIPIDILENEFLNASIQTYLPSNYNFEIHKTIHHIRHFESSCVALQMPEGLTLWATAISDIIERFTKAETVIMGDVTYGACCVDDFTARALGADFLIHYGHSCLVPVDQTSIRTLYVFVEIAIDPVHVCATIRSNFPAKHVEFQETIIEKSSSKPKLQIDLEEDDVGIKYENRSTHLVLVATVQFINSLHALKERLERNETKEEFFDISNSSQNAFEGQKRIEANKEGMKTTTNQNLKSFWYSTPYRITIPQIKPLSAGEILGCTSPKLNFDQSNAIDGIIYVGDGRFHLESIMISNPNIPAFRYDPYEKRFVKETYDHNLMRNNRANAVEEAKQTLTIKHSLSNKEEDNLQSHYRQGWGLILGTLGRQGSTRLLNHLRSMMIDKSMPTIPILLSELSPQKISLFGKDLVTFVQTSCPRLSIDWGDAFPKPLLSPYEAAVALNKIRSWQVNSKDVITSESSEKGSQEVKDVQDQNEGDYPMDFYADHSLGPWTPRFGMNVKKKNPKGISNRELLKRGLKGRG